MNVKRLWHRCLKHLYEFCGVDSPPMVDERLASIASIWDDLDEPTRQKLLQDARQMADKYHEQPKK